MATRADILQNNEAREEQGGYVDFSYFSFQLWFDAGFSMTFPWEA